MSLYRSKMGCENNLTCTNVKKFGVFLLLSTPKIIFIVFEKYSYTHQGCKKQ